MAPPPQCCLPPRRNVGDGYDMSLFSKVWNSEMGGANVNGNKIKQWFTTGLRNACKKKITYTGSFCSTEQKVLKIGTKCVKIS